LSRKPDVQTCDHQRPRVPVFSCAPPGTGPLTLLALDRAQEPPDALERSIFAGGLSKEQIDSMDLGTILFGPGTPWRRLVSFLTGWSV